MPQIVPPPDGYRAQARRHLTHDRVLAKVRVTVPTFVTTTKPYQMRQSITTSAKPLARPDTCSTWSQIIALRASC